MKVGQQCRSVIITYLVASESETLDGDGYHITSHRDELMDAGLLVSVSDE